jgi:hypothetical protein
LPSNQFNPASKAVDVIVSLTVAGLTAAFLIPVAISEIVAVDVSAWGAGASSLWNIMDMAIVLGVFVMLVGIAVASTERL